MNEKLNGCFFIEDDKLLEKFNGMRNKVSLSVMFKRNVFHKSSVTQLHNVWKPSCYSKLTKFEQMTIYGLAMKFSF